MLEQLRPLDPIMAKLPSKNPNKQTVSRGESFEAEVSVGREAAAAYLHDLADQIEEGSDLSMAGDDWEIPFTYTEPVEIEYEVEPADEGADEPLEVELEIEFKGSQDGGDGLTVR